MGIDDCKYAFSVYCLSPRRGGEEGFHSDETPFTRRELPGDMLKIPRR